MRGDVGRNMSVTKKEIFLSSKSLQALFVVKDCDAIVR